MLSIINAITLTFHLWNCRDKVWEINFRLPFIGLLFIFGFTLFIEWFFYTHLSAIQSGRASLKACMVIEPPLEYVVYDLLVSINSALSSIIFPVIGVYLMKEENER